MEQTAVEFLVDKMLYIENEYDMKLINKSEYQAKRRDIIDQAKEMDKEQKISFYVKAFTSFLSEESSEPYHEVIAEHGKEQAEEYYNKIFKSE